MTRFVYFGTPYVARDTLAYLVDAGYTPALVVTSPAAPKGRGLTLTPSETEIWAQEHGIPTYTPEKFTAEAVAHIASYKAEFGIAVAYGKILPQDMIDLFPKGILNIHYSLLPTYRGASPVETALLNGDTVSGVTVQQMVYELDAGDILAQQEVTISETDTTRTLRPRLIKEGGELLIHILPQFISGNTVPTPQDPLHATRASKIAKAEGELTLADDGRKNWNIYRALIESPGTYFFAEKNGTRIRVKVVAAEFSKGVFSITRIVPEGKSDQPFGYLAQNGWSPVS